MYISTIKALRLLDPTDLLLDYAAAPIRSYLKHRKDTIRCVVAGLMEGNQAEYTPGSQSKTRSARPVSMRTQPTPKTMEKPSSSPIDDFDRIQLDRSEATHRINTELDDKLFARNRVHTNNANATQNTGERERARSKHTRSHSMQARVFSYNSQITQTTSHGSTLHTASSSALVTVEETSDSENTTNNALYRQSRSKVAENDDFTEDEEEDVYELEDTTSSADYLQSTEDDTEFENEQEAEEKEYAQLPLSERALQLVAAHKIAISEMVEVTKEVHYMPVLIYSDDSFQEIDLVNTMEDSDTRHRGEYLRSLEQLLDRKAQVVESLQLELHRYQRVRMMER